METIRYGTFETNSSSTHAIVVPKKVNDDNYCLYDSLDHNYGFGREECRLCDNWDEKLAYAYMLLKDNCELSKDIEEFKSMVIDIWNSLDDGKKYQPTPQDVFNYIDRNGNDGNLTGDDSFLILMTRYGNYIDHSNELNGTNFLNRLKTDKDFVTRFIFNQDSYITIGGDEYRGYNIKTIGFEYDYQNEEDFDKKLKEYEKDNDVYLKGN